MPRTPSKAPAGEIVVQGKPLDAPLDPAVAAERKASKIPRNALETARTLFGQARREGEIAETLAAEYGVGVRQARRWIARMRDTFKAAPVMPPEAAKWRTEEMLLETFETARDRRTTTASGTNDDPDTRTMAICAKYLADLHGASAAQKHEHSGSVSLKHSYDDIRAKLDKLAPAAGGASAIVDAVAVGSIESVGASDDRDGGGGGDL